MLANLLLTKEGANRVSAVHRQAACSQLVKKPLQFLG